MRDRIGYTEFSFGYAFTENLIRWSASPQSTAPHFPNLVQEGQLGYDVRIDLPAYPLFFQFKLPELMVRETAAEIATHGAPLHCNFFRMGLMRRDSSRQHQLLIDLEQANPGAVFYASPMIEDMAAFNSAYNSAAIHLRSALFSAVEIGPLPDNKRHVVSYNANAACGWFCSEPVAIKLAIFEKLLPIIEGGFRETEFQRLEQVVERTHGILLEVGRERARIDEPALRQRFRSRGEDRVGRPLSERERVVAEELFVTREIARIGFGLEMIIAQPRS